ncbi:MAG: hypothetical protein Q8T08_12440, partial [Ignavibacteria bacterium]|nr:hypothetical protein [Ignavibacteria bacterium]
MIDSVIVLFSLVALVWFDWQTEVGMRVTLVMAAVGLLLMFLNLTILVSRISNYQQQSDVFVTHHATSQIPLNNNQQLSTELTQQEEEIEEQNNNKKAQERDIKQQSVEANKKGLIYFFHMPKTGGSYIGNTMRKYANTSVLFVGWEKPRT